MPTQAVSAADGNARLSDGPIAPSLVSREDARRLGLMRYFTGIPCKLGHVAERIRRSAECLQCNHANQAAAYNRRRVAIIGDTPSVAVDDSGELKTIVTLAQARNEGLTRYFTGSPCPHGHIAERRVKNSACAGCAVVRLAAWKDANKDKISAAGRIWRAKNVEKIRERRRRPQKPRVRVKAPYKYRVRVLTAAGKINARMRARMGTCLRAAKDNRKWQSFVDYSIDDLRAHLERQFVKGMSWENMGKWHIDHIVPLASYDFTSESNGDFKAAWALTNLRPLWKSKNISKGAKREFLL